jgi:hypothetical protein
MKRLLTAGLALAGLAASGAAQAGGDCINCYRQVANPPVYQPVTEPVLVTAPTTYAYVTPARYGTVTDEVEVVPARRVWRVTRDAWGRKIGCWVEVPGHREWRTRQVVTRPAEYVPVAVPAVYGLATANVLVAPASLGWEPVAHRADFPVENVLRRAY